MVSVATPSVKPQVALRRVAVGGSGQLIRSGILQDLDENAEVRGTKWYGSPGVQGISQKMMRDAHVRRSAESLCAPIRAADWDVEPATEDPVDLEVADLVRWNIFEKLSFDSILKDAQFYVRDGFSIFEVTDDAVDLPPGRFPLHPGKGKGIALTGFNLRPASTIQRFWQGSKQPDQLDSVTQWILGSDGEEAGFRKIPGDRLLRLTWEQEGANFAGLSPLRSAYGPWKIKRMLMVLDAIRHERQGVGVAQLEMPENPSPDEEAKAEEILSAMSSHEKGFINLPFGYKFSWTSGGQSTGIDIAIERCNRDIAYNMATAFMLLGTSGQGPGSHALSSTQAGQQELLLEIHGAFLSDRFSRGSDGWSPVERIVRMNYGQQVGIPKIIPRNLPTRDWAKILPVVKDLVTTGIVTPDARLEAFVRRVMKLPQHDPSTARSLLTSKGAGDALNQPSDG